MKPLFGQKLVIASHNPGKVTEFHTILSGFDIEVLAAPDLNLQEPVEAEAKEEEKKPKNEKKLAKESINNCNKGNIMSEDKSIFDKLYESVMGEDDDFELGIPGDDAPGDPGDEFGDEGGDEVTVTLTPDQAAALKAVVDQLYHLRLFQ